MPRTRLAGEFGKIRTGTKTDLRFCRLPVRPQSRSGPTHTGPLAEPPGQNFRNTVPTGQLLHPIKQIFTDASKEGWGAHLNECTARGSWSLPESKLHIHVNYLELKAVFLALKEFQDL